MEQEEREIQAERVGGQQKEEYIHMRELVKQQIKSLLQGNSGKGPVKQFKFVKEKCGWLQRNMEMRYKSRK